MVWQNLIIGMILGAAVAPLLRWLVQRPEGIGFLTLCTGLGPIPWVVARSVVVGRTATFRPPAEDVAVVAGAVLGALLALLLFQLTLARMRSNDRDETVAGFDELEWKVLRDLADMQPDERPRRWEASFTGQDIPDESPEYVSVEHTNNGNTQRVYLRCKIMGGKGNDGPEVFLTRTMLPGIAEGTRIRFKSATAGQYRSYRLFGRKDPIQNLVVGGLVLAAIGFAIDGANTMGSTLKDTDFPWLLRPPSGIIAASMVGSAVLKVVGAALVVWKGILEWEEK